MTFHVFVDLTASPGNSKLGLRMTTLHEEPSSRQTLTEEVEDSYSETDENDDSDSIAQQQPQPKSKFPISKTMGSLRDVGSSNFNTSSTGTANAPTSVINSVAAKQTAGTPSMTSSTSSGYGSQAVSYTNLTNDDTLSLRSMSVDDTPGKWMPPMFFYFRFYATFSPLAPTDSDRNGSSPPKNQTQSIMTPYTPSNGQKRFNPFMKDIPTPSTDPQPTTISTNNHKTDTIAQQNDENKNIIAIDDTNQNPLSADSETNANRRKKVSSTAAVTAPRKAEADSTTDMITSQMTNSSNSDADSTEMTISQTEVSMPDWVVVGESVLIRPYNTSGVISFIGQTHFQVKKPPVRPIQFEMTKF